MSFIGRESFRRRVYRSDDPTHMLQVVVEVDIAGTEVSPQQSGVGGEDGGHLELAQPAEEEADACQPLVEVGDHHRRGARQP